MYAAGPSWVNIVVDHYRCDNRRKTCSQSRVKHTYLMGWSNVTLGTLWNKFLQKVAEGGSELLSSVGVNEGVYTRTRVVETLCQGQG